MLGEVLFRGGFDGPGGKGNLGPFQINVTIAGNADNDKFALSIEPGEG